MVSFLLLQLLASLLLDEYLSVNIAETINWLHWATYFVNRSKIVNLSRFDQGSHSD